MPAPIITLLSLTNATSLWGCHHDCIPWESFVTQLPRGIQSFGNPTEMLHLFYYTEQHTTSKIKVDNNNINYTITLRHGGSILTPGTQNPWLKLKHTKCTWPVQYQSSRFTMLTMLGCHICFIFVLSYWTTYHLNWVDILLFSLNWDTRACYFLVLNNKMIPLLTAAFCS